MESADFICNQNTCVYLCVLLWESVCVVLNLTSSSSSSAKICFHFIDGWLVGWLQAFVCAFKCPVALLWIFGKLLFNNSPPPPLASLWCQHTCLPHLLCGQSPAELFDKCFHICYPGKEILLNKYAPLPNMKFGWMTRVRAGIWVVWWLIS